MTAFQYLSADLQMPTPRIDSLAPGVSDPADEPILPAGFYMGLGGPWDWTGVKPTETQADAATAQAQHDAALAAIAARQIGDFAAYKAAVDRLYSLGVANATAASDADLQQIADDAGRGTSPLGGITTLAKWLVLGLGAWFLVTTVGPVVRARRG